MTKVAIASDHAGYELKQRFIAELPEIEWIDLGPDDVNRVDYPDFADRVALKVSEQSAATIATIEKNTNALPSTPLFGLLICGSGQGMAMRANRYPGVRAALAWNLETARLSREHNDANVLCLGARVLEPQLAKDILLEFISTPFAGGRHTERIAKLSKPAQDD